MKLLKSRIILGAALCAIPLSATLITGCTLSERHAEIKQVEVYTSPCSVLINDLSNKRSIYEVLDTAEDIFRCGTKSNMYVSRSSIKQSLENNPFPGIQENNVLRYIYSDDILREKVPASKIKLYEKIFRVQIERLKHEGKSNLAQSVKKHRLDKILVFNKLKKSVVGN